MHILPKNTNPECSDLTQRSPIAIGWRGATGRKKLPDHTKFCILSPMVDSKPAEFRGSAYVAKFDDAVYVLHCFQKKTQKTSKADLKLAALRYRDLLKELGQ